MKRVLVADDSQENLTLCRDLLEQLGVEVLPASNGQIALDLAREHIPDLILMDMHMPVMGGLEAAGILQALPETSRIPIIALSGDGSDVGRAEALEAGCCDFLSKPYHFTVLLEKVQDHIGVSGAGLK